jgi:hypothetical protein
MSLAFAFCVLCFRWLRFRIDEGGACSMYPVTQEKNRQDLSNCRKSARLGVSHLVAFAGSFV